MNWWLKLIGRTQAKGALVIEEPSFQCMDCEWVGQLTREGRCPKCLSSGVSKTIRFDGGRSTWQ